MWLTRPLKFSYTNAMCRAIKSTLLERSVFQQLLTATTAGDILVAIKDTPYGKFVKSALEESMSKGLDAYFQYLYDKVTDRLSEREKAAFFLFFMGRKELRKRKKEFKNQKDARKIFNKLDREYVEALKKALNRLDRGDRKDLKIIAGSYFDLINIITVVRLKFIYQFDADTILQFVVPFGNIVNDNNVKKLLNLKKLSAVPSVFPAIFKKSIKDFTDLRRELYKYHIDVISKVWYGYPFKLSIPFALLRLKEIEIKNLKACIEGVYFGLPEKEIERMLVGV
ncbi:MULTISPECIES: V0D/AC39 family V-type ATPase subunit [unclassified Desulfurobacterium]|uniref:V0D/AC39 family V-type ATPase subunit n=1 Tax=Desulfurobacterium sp. TC5-1 TaxID=1158318 RepID=UPI0003B688A4|nr:V-type ATPase subunit [Desulfurobacterium sp. TC5-1]